MINEKMYGLGDEPSAIRELFAYGMARKAEIGAENVFDFSIGNPSVPAPELVRETMLELLDMDPVALHAYSPAAGLPEVKEAIAAYLSERYDTTATPGHLYLTAGAAAALASSIAAVTHPGDEVVVVSPYFPEYRTWIEAAGCTIVEVPAAVPSFQPDIEALRAAIGPKTSAVIINTPNNPVGAVYTRESLEALAAMLREREEALGRPLYLIGDEPYREITYGIEVPWVPSIYARTIVCYSYSKALSLPGERIGWVYVSDAADDGDAVAVAVAGVLGGSLTNALIGRGRPGVFRSCQGIRAAHRALGQLRRRRLGAPVLLHRPRHHRTLDARLQSPEGELRSQIEFVAIARPRFLRFIQADRFRNLVGALLVIFQRKWLYLRLRRPSQKKPALATMRPARVATRPTLGSL